MTAERDWAMSIARNAVTRTQPGYRGPRTKLISAGRRLLLERGDTTYTIDELVRRAGVAIKTFYRCFPTKEEFLLEVFTASVSGAAPRIREYVRNATDDRLARLRMVVTWPLEWHPHDEPRSRAIATEHMRVTMTSPATIAATRRPYETLVRDLIVEAAAAGLLAPDDPEWDAHLITSVVTSAYHSLVLGLGEPEPAAAAANVWRFCLTALRGGAT